ncbi:HNH endonuclease signature motif containing protein [Sphingomonas hylomeconis]|uniref:HNH endonuclease signature motif containing protein n=1 Tax=Sphingomonas hylomeconis TaxID=1395958 RepID=A0ABV7STW3_9SPHN|nr:HNH endonuclease signature motif containing protein [Sphingomonas hylomeconis]
MGKRCTRCLETKPREQFTRQASGRLYRACTACHRPHADAPHDRAYYKSPEYKRISRQRSAERQGREWRPSGPGGKGRAAGYAVPVGLTAAQAANAAWREWVAQAPVWWLARYRVASAEARRLRANDKARRYHADNLDKCRERVKRYKNAHPDVEARWGTTRWRRAASQADGTISAAAVARVLRSRRSCPYCLAPIDAATAQLDHIIPLAAGGLHGVVNLTPCCGPCNMRKSSRPFDEWLAMLAGKVRQSAEALYEQRYGAIEQGVLL